MPQIAAEDLQLLREKQFGLAKAQTMVAEVEIDLRRFVQSLIEKYKLVGKAGFDMSTGEYVE